MLLQVKLGKFEFMPSLIRQKEEEVGVDGKVDLTFFAYLLDFSILCAVRQIPNTETEPHSYRYKIQYDPKHYAVIITLCLYKV